MSATAEVALPRCLRSSTASSASSTRQPIPVPSRRTSQQVQAEKLAKKVATQNTVKRQQEAVVNVVKKNELRLQQQAEAENHADHPPTSAAVVVKVGRQRPGAPSHHKKELETDIQDQSYHPDELSQESESESDLFDENISDEDLAPEKRRKRGETRAMLESLRDCNRELTGSGDAAVLGKRKADRYVPCPKSLKKKKKGLPPSGGLRVGWILEASSKGNIGMVPQGADNDGGSEDGCEDMDHDIVAGISDNEEGDALEKQTVATAPRARLIARVQNAASIVEISKTASVVKTTSVEEFLPPSQAAAVVTSLKRIRFRDMPKELAASFNKIFIPLVYQLIACGSDPWYQPTDRDLEGLWAIASPDDVLYQDVEIRKIVSKLLLTPIHDADTRDAITSWRNKIGAHAIKCLETAVFAALPSGSGNELIETRQVYALWALQGGDRERNYYYREIDDGVDLGGNSSEESPQAPKKKGIFQSKLIASTLGVYFNSIAKLPSKNVSNNFPSAALVLAMQAVKRALMRYRTGVSVAPSGSLSHFSKSNWGDHEDTVAGDRVKVRSTSGLVDVVKKLREPTQKKIIEAAKAEAALQAVRVNNTGHDVTRASDGEQGEEESDFEIVDDDDDDE
ncbi:hypothetical protein BKA70DRAFT_1196875 [Coprinopsis sp. MPI-PUGE-AT-0042]|nr:hypothetical protein BKA70DRAFT_1196875 [Coprinopsis sp. MPI-PUGE-AT-0042]